MVRTVQHVYKRRLDLLRLREEERVEGCQLLQTKVMVLSDRSSRARRKNHEVRGLLEGEMFLQGDGRYQRTATSESSNEDS